MMPTLTSVISVNKVSMALCSRSIRVPTCPVSCARIDPESSSKNRMLGELAFDDVSPYT